MSNDANLKMALSHFKLSNLDLAKATGIDPSLISRYISGNRKLKHTSVQAEDIAEYLLMQADSIERIDWLKAQLRESGVSTESTSVINMKKNLILWISTDADMPDNDKEEAGSEKEEVHSSKGEKESKGIERGTRAITAELHKICRGVAQGDSVDLFLTSDRIRIFTDAEFATMLHETVAARKINVNVVICISGNTQHMDRIINEYMGEMVSGAMRFFTFFGSIQNVAEQLFVIFRNREVVMITESPFGAADPVGTFIADNRFVEELLQGFNATYRYSQPLFNIYDDSYTRNMIEVLYTEYCLPGELCVIKDSVNPMYMSFEAYCRVLRNENDDDGEYAWKCNEYRRFHEGFNNMLKTGMPAREVISLKRLRDIVKEEKCQMAGLYFLDTGFFDLDLQGCRDILSGYIDYLNEYPNVSLLILDDLPELHSSNCWHVKKGNNISINDWTGKAPIMFHTVQSALVQEFAKHYENVWERGAGSLGNRAYVISILQEIIQDMDRKLSE